MDDWTVEDWHAIMRIALEPLLEADRDHSQVKLATALVRGHRGILSEPVCLTWLAGYCEALLISQLREHRNAQAKP